jgi:hypothetical protein
MDESIATWVQQAKPELTELLRRWPLEAIACLDQAEATGRQLVHALLEAFFAAWTVVLEEAALRMARCCPGCAQPRKCKRRPDAPLEVLVLGLRLQLPKLYLYCETCRTGVSITRLLTGLSGGDASAELELAGAYCAAEHSYGKASGDLEVHYGEAIERTKVRRLALAVEAEAQRFAEQERQQALAAIGQEGDRPGVPVLMVQGDGGIVRTGTLTACAPGDPGYRHKTAKCQRRRRKRVVQFREVITLDVREPGQVEAGALDVVVPVVAQPDERPTRMLALAGRAGLGTDTEVLGLGDLGSELPQAFGEAFHDYPGFYSGDWQHTREYVRKAASVLCGIDAAQWQKNMKAALWNRQAPRCNLLLEQARPHRVQPLPADFTKCPLAALATYVHNNWDHLRARDLKRRGLEYVSARAEAQVRDRTKRRFGGPGAWRAENLEGKALLRAIIADGRWPRFREHYLATRTQSFQGRLTERLAQAIREGRIVPIETHEPTCMAEEQRPAA